MYFCWIYCFMMNDVFCLQSKGIHVKSSIPKNDDFPENNDVSETLCAI
ncbi:hypothetical protein Bache_1856 [Bacteroides helcogenes P 36-108]|uniref:Uncharacterized protein n=1 Tax=Bacteroides helcogenes (strain ATCC 35417 / DSM 20613 / JCM 6297 / CCUG 15421 / P 36-108) TaxID=693979 RepID=E6SP64_BACT6|nr:hypothetical protein Bache_1856 [Bacteroides helcogenes P 36-108]